MTTDLSILAEGYGANVHKKTFTVNPWPTIYAARQNNTIMQETASAVEVHKLEEQEVPCLVVMLGNVKGLVPLPESGVESKDKLRRLVGQQVAFKVITFNREDELVLLSRQRALEHMARVTWERVKEGEVRTAVAREVYRKKAVLDIGGITVELPAREAAWGWLDDMLDLIQAGDAFDVKVTQVDKEKKELEVSIKELLPCPWPDAATRYLEKNEYLGTVSGVEEFGVFVNLEPGVDALAPQMKFIVPQKGDRVLIRITRINAPEQKIGGRIARNLSRKKSK